MDGLGLPGRQWPWHHDPDTAALCIRWTLDGAAAARRRSSSSHANNCYVGEGHLREKSMTPTIICYCLLWSAAQPLRSPFAQRGAAAAGARLSAAPGLPPTPPPS